MRNLHVNIIIMCAILASCIGGPLIESKSPKSLTSEKTEKPKASDEESTITDDERKFLREIEEKYNIKRDDEEEDDEEQTVEDNNDDDSSKIPQAPLPAVIAIEIVNDNTTDGKGKRTIDANLGYGYKTNNGYYYSQFGKPEQKAKFMIYPYSQQDIPAPNKFKYHTHIYSNKAKGEKTIVEIQPSKAFQLVPINQQEQHQSQNSYQLDGSVSHIRTKYEQVESVETPPPPQYQTQEEYTPQREKFPTLYTTFNGGQLSGLSGHFPIVMPNYYVSQSQVLRHPQYQGYNLPQQEQNVLPQQKNIIPVLILRIPSSHIQNPTAEFFPKLPRNNPYATTLNNINLQGLLNQYLASVQPHYEPQAPQVDNHVLRYNQPAHYYEHQQLYTMPTVNPVQYNTHYVQENQPQYVQQQNDEEEQSVRYVVPHPSPSPETHQTISHMQLTQVYGPPSHQQSPAYEQTEEENLPFSENYPDQTHTRVIYNPHYQGAESSQSAAVQPLLTTQLVSAYPSPTPAAMKARPYISLRRPAIMHKYHSVIPSTQEHTYEKVQVGEEQQITKTTHQLPYNFHAHPYPKRQVKTADTTTKKPIHNNRRLMTAVKTSA